MERIELNVNHDILDPNFEGYKVAMDNIGFESTKLNETLFSRNRPNSMVSLQHMKIFANENSLFIDSTRSTTEKKYLYRITEDGNIEQLVFETNVRTWNVSTVTKMDIGTGNDVGYPPSIGFPSESIAVACNGINRVFVYYILPDNTWTEMLNYEVCKEQGISLLEARCIDNKMQILVHRVEENEQKKTRTRVSWITVDMADLDIVEHLTVNNKTDFIQDGHFETCTFANDGNLLFLATKSPRLENEHPDITEDEVKRTWEQHEEEIKVVFNVNTTFTQEDVKLNVTKRSIFLALKDTVLLQGTLCGEINEKDVEVGADLNENKLVLKLKTTDGIRWNELIEGEGREEKPNRQGLVKGSQEERVCGADETSEECDDAEPSLFIYWVDQNTHKTIRQCDVSGRQVLFIRHDFLTPAIICLRHDVDGILWSFEDPKHPKHSATLQAFGYVQASKMQRIWSGCSPNGNYAGIVESNNRVLVYSQSVAVEGSLVNRKTSTKVNHIAKQHLLRLESSDPIRGFYMSDHHIFALTKNGIHVVELV